MCGEESDRETDVEAFDGWVHKVILKSVKKGKIVC